jgi:Trk K+ transport system NAD-binding subunit
MGHPSLHPSPRGTRRWRLRSPRLLYALATLREFRITLLLLAVLVCIGGALYAITPLEDHTLPGVMLSLYAAWMAMLAQPLYSPPNTWYLKLLCAIYPILGVLLIGEGVVRLALLMVSRRHGEKEWMRVMASTYRDHIVLCGLGHLGFRVLEQLVFAKVPVVAIEKDEKGRFVAPAKAFGIPVLICDMKDDQALLDAGIEYARAVIIATNDDMANLEVALDSRRFNPAIRVIMRLFDQQIAGKIADAMMVDAAFSASALAAPAVAAMSMDAKVTPSAVIDGVPHVTAELSVDAKSGFCGRSIDQIEEDFAVRILARVPVDAPVQSPPPHSATIAAGDRLVVHLAAAALAAFTAAGRASAVVI